MDIYDKDICSTTAGHKLAETMGLNPIGYAASGRGNDRIISTTKLFFYDNPELMKDTFVLIGWSGVIRQDYLKTSACLSHSPKKGPSPIQDWGTWKITDPVKMEKWLALLNEDEEHECFKLNDYDINKTMRLRYLEQVLTLQDFFKLNDINYCMYNALTAYNTNTCTGLDRLTDKIDKQRFFQFNGESHLSFVCDSKKEMLTVSETDVHPNYKGHKLWADKLYDFIRTNSLC